MASLWIPGVLEGFPSEVGPGETDRQEEAPSGETVSGRDMCLKAKGQARTEVRKRQAVPRGGGERGRNTSLNARLRTWAFPAGGREPQKAPRRWRRKTELQAEMEVQGGCLERPEEGPAPGGMVGTSMNLPKTWGASGRVSGPGN